MPSEASLPGWLRRPVPENGYESPQSPENGQIPFGGSIHNDGERRRVGYTEETDHTSAEENNPGCSSNSLSNGRSTLERDVNDGGGLPEIGHRDRIGCYTWTWFTMTMATGGIANVLHSIPYRSEWLKIIGVVVFLFNIALFVMNAFFLTLRFKFKPGSFTASFTSPSESLFIPASVVSLGTILINMCQYGIPETGQWFQTVMQVCFWAYVSLSVIASSGLYLIIWSTQSFPIHTMTPIWIFPAYPLLLVAPFAANLIDALPDAATASRLNPIAIAFGAVCLQGTGFLVSLMIYAAFIYRLMTQKLPRETTRPGMFISVGPSGFTVAGIVQLGNTVIDKIAPNKYFGNEHAAFILKLISLLIGLWLWGLCLWFFIVSVGAHWQLMRPNDPDHHIQFDMTWFSFVFPNTALVTATLALGKSLESHAMKIFGTVLAVMLVPLWIYVFSMMIRAVLLKRILWPKQLDEAEVLRQRLAEGRGDKHKNLDLGSKESKKELVDR